jgi:hypothetical protein
MATDRIIEAKDNYVHVPMIEGDDFEILVNGKSVVKFKSAFNGTLKCYLAGEKHITLFNY